MTAARERTHHVWCNGNPESAVKGCRWCDPDGNGRRGLWAQYQPLDGESESDLAKRYFPNAMDREVTARGTARAPLPLLRVLSLGAGVQSTTLALMAAAGEFGVMPDCAIFADTGWEPEPVYQQVEWLRSALPFPIHVTANGNIRDGILARRNTTGGRFAAIPWFIRNQDGGDGMGRRQCSSEYKLTPIMWKVRELLGRARQDHIPAGAVEVWIGISRDEAHRMKPARQSYMVNRWPLVEKDITRAQCLAWLAAHGYKEPPKSACIGCPFHNNAMWKEMRHQRPAEFADAVAVDAALRVGEARGIRGEEFMPLAEAVDVSTETHGQGDLFANECEGICGV